MKVKDPNNLKPVLLIVFDGFGVNPSRIHNAWTLAHTPHLDFYFASYPHTTLDASGLAVGLPDGQFGSSEVGHLTLGAGRILKQELLRIAEAIRDGSLDRNPVWRELLSGAKRLHLVGMVSDGGVHSHIMHLLGILPLVVNAGLEPVIHVITDGRDTAPRAAGTYLQVLENALKTLRRGMIATVSGRYYAMDRTDHWDRTEKAWAAMIRGKGQTAETPAAAVKQAYGRDEGDEFILPTVVGNGEQAMIRRDEPVFFFNFRSDRMRQLPAAIGLDSFSAFDRGDAGARRVVSMTQYDVKFPFPAIFRPEQPPQVLAQVLSDAGLRQFHCAETEKCAHVTYFFNGGRDTPFPGEERAILPSPRIATYDLQPEMSASGVADRVIDAIESVRYQFILMNFANGDMVGHTANPQAIIRAVETLDLQSHRVMRSALAHGFRIMLTADHGNCEEMVDPATGQPHTQHTVYPVPFLIVGEPGIRLGTGRGLRDVAPTVLDLLGLPKPDVMTGGTLIVKNSLEL